jgi:hypothetical protein
MEKIVDKKIKSILQHEHKRITWLRLKDVDSPS